MCGACGAGSARSAAQHWAAPFLASLPARTAAARTLSRWSRATGWSGTVNGVAGGFEVATCSGRRSLAVDLAETLRQLGAYGVGGTALLSAATGGVVEGPPTQPGPRLRAATKVSAPPPTTTQAPVATRTLQPDPRRRYRVPGLLAWFAVAEKAGSLARVTVHLGLGDREGILLTADDACGVTCVAGSPPAEDAVFGFDRLASDELVALLCPPSCPREPASAR